MAATACWTLDELVRRVSAALADPAYPGAPNGRVREVPDRRAIRWYTTIGLVDRPAANGRAALYGVRHLLQIVAVKRRQAQGIPLADIQAEFAGVPDDILRTVAAVPDVLIGAEPLQFNEVSAATASPGPRARFWTDRPAADGAPASSPRVAERGPDSVTTLAVVRLPGGAMVLLPRQPSDDDVSAIHTAAQPLLNVLADRGLTDDPVAPR